MFVPTERKMEWSLNPNGSQWANDENSFGHKMLQKMGWSKGKGLGVNEQGITNIIKVAKKNDKAGIGTNKNYDEWSNQQQNFDKLLADLNGNNQNEPLKIESLEDKSKKSRSRVHYHKFTRGKDVSQYSPHDLLTIIGKKKEVENEEEIVSEISMYDYFKKKFTEKKTKLSQDEKVDDKSDQINFNNEKENNSECAEENDFQNKEQDNKIANLPEENSFDKNEISDVHNGKRKKNKSKKKKLALEEQVIEDSGVTKPLECENPSLDHNETSQDKNRKKKKKKTKTKDLDPERQIKEQYDSVCVEHNEASEVQKIKKKKNKSKTKDLEYVENIEPSNIENNSLEEIEVHIKKKKKRKCSEEFTIDEKVNESNSVDNNQPPPKKKNKKHQNNT